MRNAPRASLMTHPIRYTLPRIPALPPLHPGTDQVWSGATLLRGIRVLAALALVAAALTLVGPVAAQPSPPLIRYEYDELGRLITVIDVVRAQQAQYEWDAVGNLLRITRQSIVAIFDFTPRFGPVGTTVTLDGTGYSSTPSANQVTFNGVPAVVTSATPMQVVVTVPEGATTGPIVVTTPTGAATSADAFTVGGGGSGD